MAPAFCYDDTSTTSDIQWISPTESYTSQYPTRLNRSDVYYRSTYVYEPPKKPETLKERVTRQSAAFSMFYSIPQYSAKKRVKRNSNRKYQVNGKMMIK